jgi:hypothetical protein
VSAHQLAVRLASKLPPPVRRAPGWRDVLHALLRDPSVDRRPLWLLLIRIGLSVLIAISLFVIGGQLGFVIGLALFVVGPGLSARIRRF